MDQVPFTVKALKALKNTSGLKNEISHSKILHAQHIPLLISSVVLRSRHLGQVDIAVINHSQQIIIYEVKSSQQGSILSRIQYERLKNALHFLCFIFKMPGRLQVLK